MINHAIIEAIAAASNSSPAAIVAAFQDSTAEEMARLRAAMDAGATELVALHSHRICGASQMVGAGALAEASRTLNEAAERGTLPQIRTAFALLEDAVGVLNAHLEGRDES